MHEQNIIINCGKYSEENEQVISREGNVCFIHHHFIILGLENILFLKVTIVFNIHRFYTH